MFPWPDLCFQNEQRVKKREREKGSERSIQSRPVGMKVSMQKGKQGDVFLVYLQHTGSKSRQSIKATRAFTSNSIALTKENLLLSVLSLRSLYRLRKPTDRTTLHLSHRAPLFHIYIFFCPVCQRSLHILSHAPSLISHLLSLCLSPVSILSCFIFGLSLDVTHFFLSLASLQPPLLPVIAQLRSLSLLMFLSTSYPHLCICS